MKVNIEDFCKTTSLCIESPANQLIKLIKKIILNPIEYKMYCVAEGEKNILELSSSKHISVIKVLVAQDVYDKLSEEKKDFFGAKIVYTSEKVLSYLTDLDKHLGMIAVFALQYDIANADDIISSGPTYILDDIQDPGNMGTLIRTAVALGKKNIVISGGVFPFNQKVIRSSSGMIGHLRIYFFRKRVIIPLLFIMNKKLALLDMGGQILTRENASIYNDYYFILSNEGSGIHAFWKEKNIVILGLEMNARAESLNVAIAGSIAGYMVWGVLHATI